MPSDIEEVKRRSDIVDVVSSYVTLKKAGKDFKALCPFHKEKTPSFFVSPEKQIFKCFGCGEGGDIFDFVMKLEGLEFGDALKILADRAGVTLEPRTRIDREAPGLKSRLFAINRLSALFYHKILTDHPAGKTAREYLVGRGVTDQTIKQFLIGFAPSQGPLTTFLSRKTFTATEIEKAGRPDRFARRIMFPIFDVVGNVVGFSGRTIEEGGEPKYLNTPETDIFHKGRVLYGLYEAKRAIKEADRVVVAEGQMDVVMSHQAGVTNVVATSGTALTDDHLHLLFRYTPNLSLAFDTDAAGERAAEKAIMAALGQGFTVKLIALKEKDPADMVKTNPEEWEQTITQAKEAISHVIDRAMSKSQSPNAEQKKGIAKAVLPYLAALPDPIEQETWVRTLSQKLSVSEKTIYLALAKVQPSKSLTVVRAEPTPSKRSVLTPAETLIGLLLAYPQKGEQAMKELQEAGWESENLGKLYQTIRTEYAELKQNPAIAREILSKSLSPDLAKLADHLVFTVTHEFPDEGEAAAAMRQLVERVTDRRKEDLKREFATKIADAEASGNRDQVKQLMQEFQSIISK